MHRIGWLRAAVLGANDGIVSTASLIVGVAAAAESREAILLAFLAAGLRRGRFRLLGSIFRLLDDRVGLLLAEIPHGHESVGLDDRKVVVAQETFFHKPIG